MQTSHGYIDLTDYVGSVTATELNGQLATLLVTAKIQPTETNYDDMIISCWTRLSSSIDELFEQGYFPWLMLAGANLSLIRELRIRISHW